jgi:hypothetical protein
MITRHANTKSTFLRPILFARRSTPRNCLYAVLFIGLLILAGCRRSSPPAPPAPNEPNASAPAAPNEPKVSAPAAPYEPNAPAETITTETSLFDGKSLGNWRITDFGGQGKVYVKDGAIYMEMGNDMTGINWAGPLIRQNYEITLDAMRVMGNDFFCGLTFPVGDKPCSLILGGWGGGVCGLSNLDYYDAANNETTRLISFESGKWYHVRLRVTPKKIQAWLDGEDLVDVEIEGRKIGIRPEVDLSQPLGIATWQTAGAVRNIVIKPIAD